MQNSTPGKFTVVFLQTDSMKVIKIYVHMETSHSV